VIKLGFDGGLRVFIYELEEEFYNEKEQDINFIYEYIIHEKQFTKKEFEKMCSEGIGEILDKSAYELKQYLVLNYGFKNLPITSSFGF